MKLRHLHYRYLPGVSLSDLVRNHLSTLQGLVVSRSPTRLDDFMTIARLLSGNDNSNNSGDDTSDTNSSSMKHRQQRSQRGQLHTLILDRCQGAGMTALTELVRACGSHLRTLEFRQHTVIRPAGGDLAQYPLDTPGDWNAQEISQGAFEKELAENPSKTNCGPGQACRQCGSFADINSNSSNGKVDETGDDNKLEESIEGLSIASTTITTATVNDETATTTTGSIQPTPDHQQPSQHQQQQGAGIPPVGVDPETRMDLAMLMVSELCPRLTRFRLQNMTWLSDNSLSGFRPTSDHLHRSNKGDDSHDRQQHRGLKEIELLDSYYASQVTIEGLLELCGPDLETLVVDRRSCWRRRTRTQVTIAQDTHTQPPGTLTTTTTTLSKQQAGLCAGCMNQERLRRFKDETMSTGDRIISGLLSNTTTRDTRGQDSRSIQQQQVNEKENGREQHQRRQRQPRLSTLMLIEHWVSVQVVKEALCEWSRTLAVVSLRLYKCSNQVRRGLDNYEQNKAYYEKKGEKAEEEVKEE